MDKIFLLIFIFLSLLTSARASTVCDKYAEAALNRMWGAELSSLSGDSDYTNLLATKFTVTTPADNPFAPSITYSTASTNKSKIDGFVLNSKNLVVLELRNCENYSQNTPSIPPCDQQTGSGANTASPSSPSSSQITSQINSLYVLSIEKVSHKDIDGKIQFDFRAQLSAPALGVKKNLQQELKIEWIFFNNGEQITGSPDKGPKASVTISSGSLQAQANYKETASNLIEIDTDKLFSIALTEEPIDGSDTKVKLTAIVKDRSGNEVKEGPVLWKGVCVVLDTRSCEADKAGQKEDAEIVASFTSQKGSAEQKYIISPLSGLEGKIVELSHADTSATVAVSALRHGQETKDYTETLSLSSQKECTLKKEADKYIVTSTKDGFDALANIFKSADLTEHQKIQKVSEGICKITGKITSKDGLAADLQPYIFSPLPSISPTPMPQTPVELPDKSQTPACLVEKSALGDLKIKLATENRDVEIKELNGKYYVYSTTDTPFEAMIYGVNGNSISTFPATCSTVPKEQPSDLNDDPVDDPSLSGKDNDDSDDDPDELLKDKSSGKKKKKKKEDEDDIDLEDDEEKSSVVPGQGIKLLTIPPSGFYINYGFN